MTRPASYNTTWANAGQQVAGEGDAKTQEFMKTGWEGGSDKKPPHAPTQNYHMQKTDLTLQEIERQGLLSWRGDVPYQKGARVFWHGSTFQALKETLGTEPQGSGDNGTWYLVPIQNYPSSYESVHGLGTAAKHNEGDFERTGIAADLDSKLWNAITANYVAKSGGTYDGVINGQSPARGDRGSAIPTAWWCGMEFDVKGAADAVQQNLDKVNGEAWKGINGVWAKANDAQGRCGHLEYFLHGSDDRANVYVGDPTGDGILFKQEQGWWSFIYQHQTRMELTPEGKINYATISWGQVTDKYVVGEGDEMGLVHMNGSANIWDVNAKNYAASQYQARQAQETGAAAQKAADAVATRVTTLEPAVAENKALVRANWNREMLYVGSSDKQNGWFLAFEAGYVNIYWKGVRFFQIDPDKRIKDATISVGQVEGRAEWGDNWFLDKQSGKLWQWGKVYNGGEREAVVRFPRAFRDSNYAIMSMDIGNGGGWHNSRDPQTWGVTLRKNGGNNDIAGQWIAFGNG